mmetsp:Transcript_6262/g.18976  ORF Transcript_6262/g.18976 Transcript_6262/m.18976 type:complete len:271 (-) Transcript_6262:118-930(-)
MEVGEHAARRGSKRGLGHLAAEAVSRGRTDFSPRPGSIWPRQLPVSLLGLHALAGGALDDGREFVNGRGEAEKGGDADNAVQGVFENVFVKQDERRFRFPKEVVEPVVAKRCQPRNLGDLVDAVFVEVFLDIEVMIAAHGHRPRVSHDEHVPSYLFEGFVVERSWRDAGGRPDGSFRAARDGRSIRAIDIDQSLGKHADAAREVVLPRHPEVLGCTDCLDFLPPSADRHFAVATSGVARHVGESEDDHLEPGRPRLWLPEEPDGLASDSW